MPYVDDSEAVSPISEENNVHGCLADSLSGMATMSGQMGGHPGCLGRVHWLGSVDHDSFRSRQNSYCSHASRWSYTSHSLRSASRLAGGGFGGGSDEGPSGTGTRSCRNSLLIPPELCVISDSDKSRVEQFHVSLTSCRFVELLFVESRFVEKHLLVLLNIVKIIFLNVCSGKSGQTS